MATKTSPADVIIWSGSKDDQTSLVYPSSYLLLSYSSFASALKPSFNQLSHSVDATIAARATSAMSCAFITAMKKNSQQSFFQLLNSILDELATKYTQRPQLSCSHPLSKKFSSQSLMFLSNQRYLLIRCTDTNLLFVM